MSDKKMVEVRVNRFGLPKAQTKVDIGNGNIVEMYTHDEYGLAIDPKLWASKDKDCCYGRGFTWKHTTRKVEVPAVTEAAVRLGHMEIEVEEPGKVRGPNGEHIMVRKKKQVPLVVEEGKVFAIHPHQEMTPCECAMRRYNKTRQVVENRLMKAQERGEDPARELEKIHQEEGHNVRFKSNPQEAVPILIEHTK